MINTEFRKKFADNWFNFLQKQICKEFEELEKNKKSFLNVYGLRKKIMKVVEYLSLY